ncbi:MAG: type II toxin-antitoxin system VapC family toxin [Candidatus Njordarchaeota archaeon]
MKNRDSPAAKLVLMLKDEIAITSITLYELYYGPLKAGLTKEILDIDSLRKQIAVLPFDANSAEKAARIDAILHRTGQPVGLRVIFIASIALTHNLAIVTRNLRDFQRIKNAEKKLKVVTPDKVLEKLIEEQKKK